MWGSWSGALADGVRGPELVVRARALLKKVLATPICTRPIEGADGARSWRFAGVARYDLVLAGGLTGTDYFVQERPGVVDPDELFLWFAEADGVIPPRPANKVMTTYAKGGSRKLIEFHMTDDIEVTEEPGLPPISGGSDAHLPEGEVPTGCATEMAPHTPRAAQSTPGNPWRPSTAQS